MSEAFNSRAFAVLTVKSVDAQTRTISGMATTPETDRVGDIIDPLGASFSDELPLLWQHEHGKPIGTAKFGKATKAGIPFTATIHDEAEPGPLKELVDMAWQSIKAKLVRGVSIGFRALEYNFMKEGGIHFTKTEIYELSAVTIPANAGATITSIKSIDAGIRAAVGLVDRDDERPRPASQETTVVKSTPTRKQDMNVKTIGEQIANFQSTRAGFVKTQQDIMEKAASEGLTLDADQQAEFDTAQEQINAIDAHLKRLEMMEKSAVATAKVATHEAIDTSKSTTVPTYAPRVRGEVKKEPGLAFTQYTKCFLLGKTLNRSPVDIAKQLYKDDERIIALTEKAAVAAANTLNDTWAGALVLDEGGVFADFNDYLLPETIYGRFGTDGIPSLNVIPFNVPFGAETAITEGYWVGEGKPKPVTKGAFARDSLSPLKVAAITVATKELLRHSNVQAELRLRNMLVRGLRRRLDIDFINPAKAAVTNVSPASILNGLTPIPATGTGTADDVRCDIQALLGAFLAEDNSLSSAVLIMRTSTALALSLLQNPLGQSEFPGMTMRGGILLGLPVIVSDYVPADTSGAIVAIISANDIYVGDEGGFSIDMSTEASLQMDDSPTNATVNGAGSDGVVATTMTSLWQNNSVGFLAEREINWMRNPWRVSAAYLTGVNWGAC